jgi:hypothetical protein
VIHGRSSILGYFHARQVTMTDPGDCSPHCWAGLSEPESRQGKFEGLKREWGTRTHDITSCPHSLETESDPTVLLHPRHWIGGNYYFLMLPTGASPSLLAIIGFSQLTCLARILTLALAYVLRPPSMHRSCPATQRRHQCGILPP